MKNILFIHHSMVFINKKCINIPVFVKNDVRENTIMRSRSYFVNVIRTSFTFFKKKKCRREQRLYF